MVKLLKFIALLLLVLPALANASCNGCFLYVTSTLQTANQNTNVYEAVINNYGSVNAADVILTTTATLRKVSGLKHTSDGYSLKQAAGGIAPGSSFSFKYTVKKGINVVWNATCVPADITTSTSAPTQAATAAPTSQHTSAPTTAGHTSAPTTQHTSAPTTAEHTSAPTTAKQTSAPTTAKQTSAPTTTKQTSAPTTTKATTTKAPTTTKAASTKAPTTAPTTVKATTAPTSSSSTGKVCPGSSWWAPSPQTTWQWQLTGTIDTSVDVQMYDIDLFDNTADTIAKLHSEGRVVICYFSTQYENWRPDASSFTSAVLGNGLDGWAGENYVDIRSDVVRNIMKERLALAASKGCDGVEPDNVDGYEASTGFPLTAADQLNFNEFLASSAHAVGLSVGLKNDVDQASTLQPYFDWALNEQCHEYSECDTLDSFVKAGKPVFNCEYSGSASTVCPYMVGLKFSSIIKSLDLTASIKAQCCTYQSGGCAAKAAYTCVTSSGGTANQQVITDDNTTNEQADKLVSSASAAYVSIATVAVVAAAALAF